MITLSSFGESSEAISSSITESTIYPPEIAGTAIYVIPRGGFGNILFNVMIGYALSKRYGLKLVFVQDTHIGHRKHMKTYEIFKDLNYITANCINGTRITDPSFTYTPITLTLDKDYVLDGYFQSYKYSLGYIDDIKTLLFNYSGYSNIRTKYNQIKGNDTTILLHVRRGDYLTLANYHPVMSDQYYKTAIDHILSKHKESNLTGEIKILVFSDDIPYVKSWNLLKQYNHTIIEDINFEDCFCFMTMCDHFIIANSSYSLLAYYFRDNIVSDDRRNGNHEAELCIPSLWFGPSGPKYEISDLVDTSGRVTIIDPSGNIVN